MKHILLSRI